MHSALAVVLAYGTLLTSVSGLQCYSAKTTRDKCPSGSSCLAPGSDCGLCMVKRIDGDGGAHSYEYACEQSLPAKMKLDECTTIATYGKRTKDFAPDGTVGRVCFCGGNLCNTAKYVDNATIVQDKSKPANFAPSAVQSSILLTLMVLAVTHFY